VGRGGRVYTKSLLVGRQSGSALPHSKKGAVAGRSCVSASRRRESGRKKRRSVTRKVRETRLYRCRWARVRGLRPGVVVTWVEFWKGGVEPPHSIEKQNGGLDEAAAVKLKIVGK
jgi:hypothetical protein